MEAERRKTFIAKFTARVKVDLTTFNKFYETGLQFCQNHLNTSKYIVI